MPPHCSRVSATAPESACFDERRKAYQLNTVYKRVARPFFPRTCARIAHQRALARQRAQATSASDGSVSFARMVVGGSGSNSRRWEVRDRKEVAEPVRALDVEGNESDEDTKEEEMLLEKSGLYLSDEEEDDTKTNVFTYEMDRRFHIM